MKALMGVVVSKEAVSRESFHSEEEENFDPVITGKEPISLHWSGVKLKLLEAMKDVLKATLVRRASWASSTASSPVTWMKQVTPADSKIDVESKR